MTYFWHCLEVSQVLTGKVVTDQNAKVAEVDNASKSDQYKEISENDLLASKKRGTLKEENGQPVEPRSPEIPRIRKTVPGSLSENGHIDVAAGCSAYHSNIQDERSSRTAGCSAYPMDDSHLVEQFFFSCIAERARGIVGQLTDISSRARQLLS